MTTKVNPLEAYSIYMAVKLHFNEGKYDAFKFNFKGPRVNRAKFEGSRDRYAFEKLARAYPKRQDLINFVLANVLAGNTWVRNMTDEFYMQWVSRMQRLQYQFDNDVQVLKEYANEHSLNFDGLLTPQGNQVPIIDLLRKNYIHAETVIAIDTMVGFLSRINKTAMSDPLGITSDVVYKLQQYKPFLVPRINTSASKKSIIKLFT